MEENIKTTIRIPKVLVKQFKELASDTQTSFNDSVQIAMEFFLKKDIQEQKKLVKQKKKVLKLPSKNLGKIGSLNRMEFYEGTF